MNYRTFKYTEIIEEIFHEQSELIDLTDDLLDSTRSIPVVDLTMADHQPDGEISTSQMLIEEDVNGVVDQSNELSEVYDEEGVDSDWDRASEVSSGCEHSSVRDLAISPYFGEQTIEEICGSPAYRPTTPTYDRHY